MRTHAVLVDDIDDHVPLTAVTDRVGQQKRHLAGVNIEVCGAENILEEERTIKALHPTNRGFAILEVDTVLKERGVLP